MATTDLLGGQEFLWINKDTTSETLSNNKGDISRIRSVNRHVQRWRKNKLKFQKPGSTSINSISYKSQRKFHTTASELNHRSEGEIPQRMPSRRQYSDIQLYRPPQNGSPIDPFSSSSVPITGEVYVILKHFTDSFLSGAIQTQIRNVLSPKKPSVSEHMATVKIVRECVSDERHMYSVLAMTASQLKYMIGYNLERREGPEYFMGKALKGLRGSLDAEAMTAAAQQLILDFGFLALAEVYRENYDGANVHLEITRYLVKKLGGWTKVDPFAREMNRVFDIFMSSLFVTPPAFPDLAGDQGPLSEAFRSEIESRSISKPRVGSALLEIKQLFGPVMTLAVYQLVDLAQAAQFLWNTHDDPRVDADDKDWVLQRNHELMYRFLSLAPSPLLSDGSSFEERVQECCRLCLILWLFYVLGGTSALPEEPGKIKKSRNMSPGHLHTLKIAIEYADNVDGYPTRWGPYQDLLLWILGIGTSGIRRKTEVGSWFAVELQTLARHRGIYTYDAYATITSTYLPIDRLEQLNDRRLAMLLINNDVT